VKVRFNHQSIGLWGNQGTLLETMSCDTLFSIVDISIFRYEAHAASIWLALGVGDRGGFFLWTFEREWQG